jgi:putative nucleotidyltransferase with HDIG domain
VIRAYEQAITSAEQSGTHNVLAEALRRLAVVHHHDGKWTLARRLVERSLAVACAAADEVLAAEALNTLGGMKLEANALADARQHFLLALELGRKSRELRARVEQNLGILANIQGDFDEALTRYGRSLGAYRASYDEHGCAIAYHNLGMVSAERRRYDDAEQYYKDSYDIAARLGDTHLQQLCLLNHAEVLIARGSYERAKQNAGAALSLAPPGGGVTSQAYRIIGMADRESGRRALALSRLQSSVDIAETAGSTLNEAAGRRELALLYQKMGRNREALTLLNEAHALFSRLNARAHVVSIAGRMAELEATYLAVVREWGRSIESTDTYTYGHCERVADHAVRVARALHLDQTAQTTIRLGAYLHDLGKVRLPAEVLAKPGPLSTEELAIIRTHPERGIELLAGIEFPWDLKPIIRWHHERYDGTGYPDGLRGNEIPVAAQIVGIVDVYDALTTSRPYRAAVGPERALAEIARCRTWWSPLVYDAFLASRDVPDSDDVARVPAILPFPPRESAAGARISP